MINENSSNEFDDLEAPLDAAVEAMLKESIPNDAIKRVKDRAGKLDQQKVRLSSSGYWLKIKSHSLVRYSVFSLAIIFVLLMIPFYLNRTSVFAFADVVDNVNKSSFIQLTMTLKQGPKHEMKSEMYFDKNWIRVEHFNGQLVWIGDLEKKHAMIFDNKRKFFQTRKIDNRIAKMFANPIDQLRNIKSDHAKSMGEENLKGRLTHVFQIQKDHVPEILNAAMIKNSEMTVWVDAKNKLPVKIIIRDLNQKTKDKILIENIVWNKPHDVTLFDMTVPVGFQEGIVVTDPPRKSQKRPGLPPKVSHADFKKGVLCNDRVPAEITWGLESKTVSAMMRDPESVAMRERGRAELRRWNVGTGQLLWFVEVGGSSCFTTSMKTNSIVNVKEYDIQVRDLMTGKVADTWNVNESLLPLAFSPDGKTLVAGISEWGQQPSGKGQSGGVQFWDVAKGELKFSTKSDKPTTNIKYSHDGKYVASSSNSGPVKLWASATGKLVRTFESNGKVDFSYDGLLLACKSPKCTLVKNEKAEDVIIFNLQTGKVLKTLSGDKHTKENWILWISFSPDAQLIAAASWDGTVQIWNVSTGMLLKTIITHKAGVLCSQFSPDGKFLATGSEDKTLRVWNIKKLLAP